MQQVIASEQVQSLTEYAQERSQHYAKVFGGLRDAARDLMLGRRASVPHAEQRMGSTGFSVGECPLAEMLCDVLHSTATYHTLTDLLREADERALHGAVSRLRECIACEFARIETPRLIAAGWKPE